jgi:hypothetical protein
MAASRKISIPTLSAALLLTTLSTQALAQAPAGAPPQGGAQQGGAQGDVSEVNTIKDVFARLFGCWKPPSASVATPMDITVIVSFNRSGAIMGRPRITYESPKATDNDRLAYRLAVMEALQRCSPMPFTESMAGAIAGHPFAVQFRTHLKTQEKRAWLSPKIL